MANSAQSLRPGSNTKQALRQDIQNLKENASELRDDLLEASSEHFDDLKKDFSKHMSNASRYIRENPGQSVALAAAAGAFACLLFSRR